MCDENESFKEWFRNYKRWEKENQKRYEADPARYHREEKEKHEKRMTDQYCNFKYDDPNVSSKLL